MSLGAGRHFFLIISIFKIKFVILPQGLFQFFVFHIPFHFQWIFPQRAENIHNLHWQLCMFLEISFDMVITADQGGDNEGVKQDNNFFSHGRNSYIFCSYEQIADKINWMK